MPQIKKRKKKPQSSSRAQKMMNQTYAPLPRIENETPIRLESLERRNRRGTMSTKEYDKIGKRRPGVSDPRFHGARGDKKKDPLNLIGRAIGDDQTSRQIGKIGRRNKKKKRQMDWGFFFLFLICGIIFVPYFCSPSLNCRCRLGLRHLSFFFFTL